jgi:DNA topoisomerase-1
MHRDPPPEVGRVCPKCGKPLVKRYSVKAHTYFVGCSGFPECTYHEFPNQENHHAQELLEELCPVCGKQLAVRYNHRGQKFIGCTNFPKCHYTRPFGISEAEAQILRDEAPKKKKEGKAYKPSATVQKILDKEHAAQPPVVPTKKPEKKDEE